MGERRLPKMDGFTRKSFPWTRKFGFISEIFRNKAKSPIKIFVPGSKSFPEGWPARFRGRDEAGSGSGGGGWSEGRKARSAGSMRAR
jgi:hypothetical protein